MPDRFGVGHISPPLHLCNVCQCIAMSICTTYRVHNAVKVIKIGVLVDRDVLLELRNQIEDCLVCGDKEVFFLICPIEQYVLSGILPGDMTMHMLRVSSLLSLSLSSA